MTVVKTLALLIATAMAGLGSSGCQFDERWRNTSPYPDRLRPPPEAPPEIRFCNDHTGHIAGKRPIYAGGECCCTPSLALIEAYRRDGWFEKGTLAELQAGYDSIGVKTRSDHDLCNNLCASGPHVVKGGRCLVPPQPGTLNYEEVLTGDFVLNPWETGRVEAHGGPVPSAQWQSQPENPSPQAPE